MPMPKMPPMPEEPDHGWTDPRRFGGDIAGPGGSHDRDAVVVDTRNAVIPDGLTVSAFERELTADLTEPLLACVVEGRVNQTSEPVRFLMILNTDAAAAIVSEIVGVASRDIKMREATDDVAEGFGAQFKVALDLRMEQMP